MANNYIQFTYNIIFFISSFTDGGREFLIQKLLYYFS